MFKDLMFLIFETRAAYEVIDMNVLVEKAKNKDEQAFETIVARLRNRIEVYIKKLFSMDHHYLYQESLIVLYECIQKYDKTRCDQFEPFYFYKLKLRLKDVLRAHYKTYKALPLESLDDVDETGRALIDQMIDERVLNPQSECEYLDLLERMTPIQLSLTHIEYRVLKALMNTLPIAEIASLEKVSEKTIYNTINRLKHKVYHYLETSN